MAVHDFRPFRTRSELIEPEYDAPDFFGPDDISTPQEHFHGCPTPTGRPFDCDYCQERARSMAAD